MTIRDAITTHTSKPGDAWARSNILPTKPGFVLFMHDSKPDLEHLDFRHANVTLKAGHHLKPDKHGHRALSAACGQYGTACDIDVDFYAFDRNSITELIASFEMLVRDAVSDPRRVAVSVNWQITDAVYAENADRLDYCFRTLADANVPVFVAAGNMGTDLVIYPCNHKSVIITGSHDKDGMISLFNNTPELIRVFALGKDVRVASLDSRTGYTTDSGTSFSNSAVAAAMAYYDTVDELLAASIQNTLNWKRASLNKLTSRALFCGDLDRTRSVNNVTHGNTELKYEDGLQIIVHDFNTRNYSSDKTHVEYCVEHINEKLAGENVWIPMSGGLDSEYVMHCALQSEARVRPVIMRYMSDFGKPLNEYDYKNAIAYCEANNLEPRFIDAKIRELFDNGEYWYFVKKFITRSPQLAAHLWMINQLDANCILPGDPLTLHGSGNIGIQPYDYYCYDRMFHSKHMTSSIARLHTASGNIVKKSLEITASLDPAMAPAERKHEFYSRCGMPDTAPRIKYTGFEKVREEYDKKYSAIDYFNRKFRMPAKHLHTYGSKFFYDGLD